MPTMAPVLTQKRMTNCSKQKRAQALKDQAEDAWEYVRSEVFAHVEQALFLQEDDTGVANAASIRAGPRGPPVDLEDEAEAEGEEH